MTIQSLSYLFFVLLIWLVAWPIKTIRIRQLLFLLASWLFYATWGLGFLAILIASSLLNYAWGCILRKQPTPGNLWIGIGLNLVILGTFKYLPALEHLMGAGIVGDNFLSHILMPVGISFWTFQALSYLFDIYREEEAAPSLLEFFLYMAFWPTVLSGPVCRISDMLPQFRQASRPEWDDIAVGVRRILMGLFMKVVLAQLLASGRGPGEGITDGFDKIAGGWGGLDVWFLAIGFGFQLFFDFAGYSHIVIGTARLFGFRLVENFARPYLSTTPSVFWTRWHMSLSFWIRDYVFMPLATRRRSLWWRNLMLVVAMTLFGLWHGPAITFILWGLYHGLLLVGHRQLQQRKRQLSISWPDYVETPLSWVVTFAFISLGWIFFRANSIDQALAMLGTVLSPSSYGRLALRPNFYIVSTFVISGYFAYVLIESWLVQWQTRPILQRTVWLLSPLYYTAIIFLSIVWSRQETLFIYFQF